MDRIRVAAGSLLLMVGSAAQAEALSCEEYQGELGLGPLTVRSQSPGQALRLAPMPLLPVVLPEGEQVARLHGSVTSVYARDPDFFLDFHMTDVRAGLGVGVGHCWSLEVAFSQRRVVNAYLDDVTLGFHRLFNYDNAGHDEAPRNDTQIELPHYGVYLDQGDRGIFSQAVEVNVSRLLQPARAFAPAVAITVLGRYEMLRESDDREREPDVGLELSLGKRLSERGHVYANLAHVWFGSDDFVGIALTREQFTGMLTYEFRSTPERSWVAQYLYSDGVIKDVHALNDAAHEVHLGAKWRSERFIWEFALIQNVITYNNSPDFGFSGGVAYRF